MSEHTVVEVKGTHSLQEALADKPLLTAWLRDLVRQTFDVLVTQGKLALQPAGDGTVEVMTPEELARLGVPAGLGEEKR